MLWQVAVERCCVVWCALELAWRAVPALARCLLRVSLDTRMRVCEGVCERVWVCGLCSVIACCCVVGCPSECWVRALASGFVVGGVLRFQL